MGLNQESKQVLVNRNSAKFSFDKNVKALNMQVNADLFASLNIKWT